jgi:hypothetical protein
LSFTCIDCWWWLLWYCCCCNKCVFWVDDASVDVFIFILVLAVL